MWRERERGLGFSTDAQLAARRRAEVRHHGRELACHGCGRAGDLRQKKHTSTISPALLTVNNLSLAFFESAFLPGFSRVLS